MNVIRANQMTLMGGAYNRRQRRRNERKGFLHQLL